MENYSFNSYPDSGESSPRSREIEFENPPPWDDQQPPPNYKAKFMCSYGGKIHPRPHDNQLSYLGGETKILAVDRYIKFDAIISKLSALCADAEVAFKPHTNTTSFRCIHQALCSSQSKESPSPPDSPEQWPRVRRPCSLSFLSKNEAPSMFRSAQSTMARSSSARVARRGYSADSVPERKVAVLGASMGIGQPLLALYDIAGTQGVAADVSHINSRSEVAGYMGDNQLGTCYQISLLCHRKVCRDLLWVPPLCRKLDSPGCNPRKTCMYQVSYGDGSFTFGDFSTKTLTIRRTRVPHVALGCGHDNEGLFVGAAGLLGLGRGRRRRIVG